jgi:hypothetical protein
MRVLSAIGAGAALLIACGVPATSHADAPSPAPATAVAQPPAPGCTCPVRPHRHAWRVHTYTRLHARHWREWWPAPVAVVPPPPAYGPVYYNPLLPDPYDSTYDRAMIWHYRSPAVSGEYFPDPGYPPPPPVWGGHPYRYQAGGTVFQYDGMADAYIPR